MCSSVSPGESSQSLVVGQVNAGTAGARVLTGKGQ